MLYSVSTIENNFLWIYIMLAYYHYPFESNNEFKEYTEDGLMGYIYSVIG
jgi:hypothetical protein